MADKISELQDWLLPLDKVPSFVPDSTVIGQLVTQLKQYGEEVSNLPRGLVTVLRILRHLAIDPHPDKDTGGWLKYVERFIMRQLFYTRLCLQKCSINVVGSSLTYCLFPIRLTLVGVLDESRI